MLLDFKEKKIAMDIHAKNARNTDKEENQTALRFCTAYSMLKGNGTKKAAQPLGEEIRQFLLGNAMLTRTPKSQVLTSTIVNFLLIAHLGHSSSGLAYGLFYMYSFHSKYFLHPSLQAEKAAPFETFHFHGKRAKELVDTTMALQSSAQNWPMALLLPLD